MRSPPFSTSTAFAEWMSLAARWARASCSSLPDAASGTAIALDPGGFWSRGERRFFGFTIGVSIRLVRLLQPLMPFMTTNPITRSLLLAQLSAHPWRLPADATLNEMRSYAAAPSFDAVLDSLANGPPQPGLSVDAMKAPIDIVWGRQDRVCFPRQSRRAMARFPGARLTWFEECGHFPHWDQPQQTVRFILSVTSPHGAQAMTDQPIREPEPPDRRLDRTDQEPESEEDSAPIRPSAAEGGGGEDGGPRPPRPSQAEGERDPSD